MTDIQIAFKIVPSVASSNLTLALKSTSGADPSIASPVYANINGVEHTLTAALSVTVAAAANTFNSGAAELATQAIDYFAYLGYNATEGVVIGFSRIPSARRYNDFSATATNEKYCAISDISNAAASDAYVVVGRFTATLSAGAGYTWTVPTFHPGILVQYPIYETRWLSWQPTIVGYSADPTTDTYQYRVGQDGSVALVLSETDNGTGNATTRTYTAPFTSSTTIFSLSSYPLDNGTALAPSLTRINASSNSWEFAALADFSGWTNSGNSRMRGSTITIIL